MKAIIFLFFAGLLAVQAANFRVIYVPQLIDLDELQLQYKYEDEDHQLWTMGEVVTNVKTGVNQAVTNVANTANQVGNNINQVGKNVVNTANQVGKNVVSTANQVGHNIANTANQVGTNIAKTANQVGQNVATTYHHIVDDIKELKHAFQHGFTEAERFIIRNSKPTLDLLIKVGGFSDAAEAWRHVDWNTGRGLPLAIQLTARDSSKLYNNLNKLSGGRLNGMAVRVAEKVAMSACPPAAIAIKAGVVSFRIAGQLHDITSMIHTIRVDAHSGDWAGVAIESYKLFSLIAQDFA